MKQESKTCLSLLDQTERDRGREKRGWREREEVGDREKWEIGEKNEMKETQGKAK